MSALEELKTASHSKERKDKSKLLEFGEAKTLVGTPATAPEGCVALKAPNGFVVTVKESDVSEVQKQDGLFFAKVKLGASVLVSFEMVTTLTGAAKGCSCGEKDGTAESGEGAIARTNAGRGNTGGLGEMFGCYHCEPDWICRPFRLGNEIWETCVFVLRCRNDCIMV
jgi:hypothetical protein